MIGGARIGGVVVAGLVALSSFLADARAEEPAGRVAVASHTVLLHEGRSIRVTSTGDGPAVVSVVNGRRNDPSNGYGIVALEDGTLLVVRYHTAPCGTTRYTLRHVDADGRVDWSRELAAAPATAPASRRIAVATAAREAVLTVTP